MGFVVFVLFIGIFVVFYILICHMISVVKRVGKKYSKVIVNKL